MRVKTLVLGSASLTILALAAPAFAQDNPAPPPGPGTPAGATSTDANAATPGQQGQSSTSPGADANNGDTIVVTGLRRSLQSAESLKRNAPQQIDAVVAEDIGKLPDIAVSDTAARIPGVQVDRGGGEAGRVLVRGLPDFETTYNGREIFTAETRVVALQDFPSANIAALEVYKTSTADLVEPGLAGLVNVRSRRPFDFKGLEVAGSGWLLYPKQSQRVTPNGNLLISDRWQAGEGEVGALINFSYTELQYLDSERSNTDFVADPTLNGQHVRFPDIQRIFYGSGDRTRPSINGAIQYRPHPGLEFYFEGLWQGFRNKISDHQIAVPLWGGQSYSNIVTVPGTNLVQSGTVVNPFRPDGFQGGTFNKTDTYQFAFGGSLDSGPLRITADVAHTSSKFTGSTESVDYAFASPQTVNFNTDVQHGDGGSEFSLVGFDPANRANYIYRGFYEEHQVAKGSDWQARVDGQYEANWAFISKIEAGLRFVDRKAHREFGNRYWNFEGNRIPITAVPLDYELFHTGFRGSDIQPFRVWMAPTYDSIRQDAVAMRQFNMALGGTAFGVPGVGDVPPDPLQTYDAEEKTYAGYGQIRYAFGAGVRVDGTIGVRVVRTEDSLSGTANVNNVFTPVSIDRGYTDVLPNFNARVQFTNQLQLRLSATKTRTRPNFADLNPSVTIGPPPSTCPPGGAGDPYACARTGGGGNPYLKPFTSKNYDASLEYYFSRSGFLAVAAFRRDLKGFFQNQQIRRIDPTLGPLIINGPVNTGKGRIDGLEAQAQTFFDVLGGLPDWIKGFGVQANVTYLDAKTGFPTGTGTFNLQPIIGVSKWTWNVAGMYEHSGLSVRLSYNRRGSYTATIQDRGDDIYFERVKPISRLDLSTSYNLFNNFTIFFDWTNMLGKPFESTLSSARAGAPRVEFPRFTRYEETIFSGGIRFRF